MPTIGVYQLSDVTLVAGPDPWTPGSNAEPGAPGSTIIMIDPGASAIQVDITDGDAFFDDADNSQDLTNPATVNGTNYAAGQNFENEYAYGIRPVGSVDPAEQITVYAIDEGGNTPTFAFAATSPLTPGVQYEIISIEDNNPTVSYTDLFVCFDKGTRIATPTGHAPIEHLRAGDPVLTMDQGAQPILWIGRRELALTADNAGQKPLLFRPGSLAEHMPRNELRLSPQHRVYLNCPDVEQLTGHEEALAPAKSFANRTGVRIMKGRKSVCYYTVLLQQHGIIFAEGVPVESLYPSEYSMSLLSIPQRLEIHAALPNLTRDVTASYSSPARPFLKPGDLRDLPKDVPLLKSGTKRSSRPLRAYRVAGPGPGQIRPKDAAEFRNP